MASNYDKVAAIAWSFIFFWAVLAVAAFGLDAPRLGESFLWALGGSLLCAAFIEKAVD